MNKPTPINTVIVNGIQFKAQPLGPHGSSVGVEEDYRKRVANATQGLTDLLDIAGMILVRLRQEKADGHKNFICAGFVPELHAALTRCGSKSAL